MFLHAAGPFPHKETTRRKRKKNARRSDACSRVKRALRADAALDRNLAGDSEEAGPAGRGGAATASQLGFAMTTNEDRAVEHVRAINRAAAANRSHDWAVIVDGPGDDEFTVMSLRSAVRTGFGTDGSATITPRSSKPGSPVIGRGRMDDDGRDQAGHPFERVGLLTRTADCSRVSRAARSSKCTLVQSCLAATANDAYGDTRIRRECSTGDLPRAPRRRPACSASTGATPSLGAFRVGHARPPSRAALRRFVQEMRPVLTDPAHRGQCESLAQSYGL